MKALDRPEIEKHIEAFRRSRAYFVRELRKDKRFAHLRGRFFEVLMLLDSYAYSTSYLPEAFYRCLEYVNLEKGLEKGLEILKHKIAKQFGVRCQICGAVAFLRTFKAPNWYQNNDLYPIAIPVRRKNRKKYPRRHGINPPKLIDIDEIHHYRMKKKKRIALVAEAEAENKCRLDNHEKKPRRWTAFVLPPIKKRRVYLGGMADVSNDTSLCWFCSEEYRRASHIHGMRPFYDRDEHDFMLWLAHLLRNPKKLKETQTGELRVINVDFFIWGNPYVYGLRSSGRMKLTAHPHKSSKRERFNHEGST